MKEQFDFGQAIAHLKDGKKVQRAGWNGKGMYLQFQDERYLAYPDDLASEDRPHKIDAHILMRTVQCTLVPWLASQTDILAEDWQLF